VTIDRADQAPVAIRGVLLDLLMAVMNSVELWTSAAGDPRRGLAWRDAVTARMAAVGTYVPYEALVGQAAAELGLSIAATQHLLARWPAMEPWPDAQASIRDSSSRRRTRDASSRPRRSTTKVVAGLDSRRTKSPSSPVRHTMPPAHARPACSRGSWYAAMTNLP
jgi:hypothetical protein